MITCPTTTPRPGEWILLWRDPWLLALTVWLPPLLFLLIAALFAEGVARDLAIGVVDGDRSRLARQLIRQYDASPTLEVTAVYPSQEEGLRAMRGGGIYGLIVIPSDLEKEVMLARSPQVEAYYNSQFLLIGRLVKAAILQVHGTAAATVAARRQLAAGLPVIDQAMAAVLPLGSQATPPSTTGRAVMPSSWSPRSSQPSGKSVLLPQACWPWRRNCVATAWPSGWAHGLCRPWLANCCRIPCFSATDMNPLARLWRSCLPISHYMEIQIGQASYGAPLVDALPQLIRLLGFLVLFAVSLLLARRFSSPAPEVTR